MKEYICDRCGYIAHQKSNLKSHLIRKNTCDPLLCDVSVDELVIKLETKQGTLVTCSCGKAYTTKQGFNNHKKTCNLTPQNNNLEIIELKKQVKLLQENLKRLENIKTIHNENHIHQENNIQVNVVVPNAFGNENLAFLTERFLTNCLLNQNDGLKELVKEIHYNQNIPENHNIRFKSSKQKLLETYTDGRWIESDQNNTLDSMIQSGYRILFRHFIKNKEIDSEIKEREEYVLNYLQDLGTNRKTAYFQLRRDLLLLIKDCTLYVLSKRSE